MLSQVKTIARHCRNVVQAGGGMLLPTKTALEMGVKYRMAHLDTHLPIPSIYLRRMFPVNEVDFANTVKLLPGTALDGGPNIFEQFILCALIKMIKPQTILEIGTFRGGTTWNLFENAPEDAIIYTVDLPEDETPGYVTNFEYASNKKRPFVPRSERVRQLLVNSRKWDGVLDRKVQFAFIDADHSYAGIKNDTEKALVSLDDDGCICWHDSMETDYGYGTLPYLLSLRQQGWKIFRIRSMHEISGVAIWMADKLFERLKLPEPQSGEYMFRDYVGR
jgi:Methyltransferase domain